MRSPPERPEGGRFRVYKTVTRDGGLTWSDPQVIASHPDAHLCEPRAIRSPDGKTIAVLLRENSRKHGSFLITSVDEGRTWSEPRELPAALTGDRHVGRYAPDGRLFLTFRDNVVAGSPTKGDWAGWVGTWDDLVSGREGQAGVLEESGGRERGFGPSPEKRFKWDAKKTSTDWGAYPERDDQMPDFRSAKWAVERLEQEHERPFFLAVGFLRPHVPWYVPAKWFDLHPPEMLETPPYLPSDSDDIPELAKKLMAVPMMPTAEWARRSGEWRNIVQAYLASVSFADHYVGEVLNALDADAYADNTVVVLWGDHGYHIGEKNRFAKHSLWEEATHTPLIVSAPGFRRGRRSAKAVELIDIYPTLVDLCGLPKNERNEGHSLQPLLENPDADWEHAALTTYGYGNPSVRDERYRYSVYEDGSEELYDHASDPNEWRNLAAEPSQAATKARLGEFLPKNEAKWSPAAPCDCNDYLSDAFERHKAKP